MSGIELFGFVAVLVMVAAYALEDRAPAFVLLFAISCLAAASYAALIRSWPFAGVEMVWGIIAFRRWRRRTAHRAERTLKLTEEALSAAFHDARVQTLSSGRSMVARNTPADHGADEYTRERIRHPMVFLDDHSNAEDHRDRHGGAAKRGPSIP